MAWHLTRVQDGVISRLQGIGTEWDTNGWAARFGIEGEMPQWTPENVHEFDPVDAATLLGYYDAVRARTSAYVGGLTADALAVEQEPFRPGAPPMTVAPDAGPGPRRQCAAHRPNRLPARCGQGAGLVLAAG